MHISVISREELPGVKFDLEQTYFSTDLGRGAPTHSTVRDDFTTDKPWEITVVSVQHDGLELLVHYINQLPTMVTFADDLNDGRVVTLLHSDNISLLLERTMGKQVWTSVQPIGTPWAAYIHSDDGRFEYYLGQTSLPGFKQQVPVYTGVAELECDVWHYTKDHYDYMEMCLWRHSNQYNHYLRLLPAINIKQLSRKSDIYYNSSVPVVDDFYMELSAAVFEIVPFAYRFAISRKGRSIAVELTTEADQQDPRLTLLKATLTELILTQVDSTGFTTVVNGKSDGTAHVITEQHDRISWAVQLNHVLGRLLHINQRLFAHYAKYHNQGR